jgi:hypothetical protein
LLYIFESSELITGFEIRGFKGNCACLVNEGCSVLMLASVSEGALLVVLILLLRILTSLDLLWVLGFLFTGSYFLGSLSSYSTPSVEILAFSFRLALVARRLRTVMS